MRPKIKLIFILIGLTFFCSSISLAQDAEDGWKCYYTGTREAALAEKKRLAKQGIIQDLNDPAYVKDLTLDRWELIAGQEDFRVKVFTDHADPEGDVVLFKYRVSAGKIIGVGAKVIWDLTNVGPGTYTIQAGVNDGIGICGETKTRRLEILECAGCTLRETE